MLFLIIIKNQCAVSEECYLVLQYRVRIQSLLKAPVNISLLILLKYLNSIKSSLNIKHLNAS